jgi:hypothetical protein
MPREASRIPRQAGEEVKAAGSPTTMIAGAAVAHSSGAGVPIRLPLQRFAQ